MYNDTFSISSQEYFSKSGQYDDEGNRLVQNTESNGRFHTDWLNMFYPRLKIARDLLKGDGVIFISIDDNEQDNTKNVMKYLALITLYLNSHEKEVVDDKIVNTTQLFTSMFSVTQKILIVTHLANGIFHCNLIDLLLDRVELF